MFQRFFQIQHSNLSFRFLIFFFPNFASLPFPSPLSLCSLIPRSPPASFTAHFFTIPLSLPFSSPLSPASLINLSLSYPPHTSFLSSPLLTLSFSTAVRSSPFSFLHFPSLPHPTFLTPPYSHPSPFSPLPQLSHLLHHPTLLPQLLSFYPFLAKFLLLFPIHLAKIPTPLFIIY